MICFRDKQFCDHSADCKVLSCPSRFGEAQKADAERWWKGPDAPVCFGPFPDCPHYQKGGDA